MTFAVRSFSFSSGFPESPKLPEKQGQEFQQLSSVIQIQFSEIFELIPFQNHRRFVFFFKGTAASSHIGI
jgi:hypothetical protein